MKSGHLLRFGAPLLFAVLAACEPAPPQTTIPVELTADSHCSLDGMLLAGYAGPKAQIHYSEGTPELFCDPVEMFSVYLQPEQQKRVIALYVQDMGKTEWAAPEGQWIDARTAFFVVGSRLRGSMGPTFATFATEAAALALAEKEGGKVLRFEQITLDMSALDGGVLKDKAM